jgi:hypothetical protein
MRYSQGFKQSILKKVLPPESSYRISGERWMRWNSAESGPAVPYQNTAIPVLITVSPRAPR